MWNGRGHDVDDNVERNGIKDEARARNELEVPFGKSFGQILSLVADCSQISWDTIIERNFRTRAVPVLAWSPGSSKVNLRAGHHQ